MRSPSAFNRKLENVRNVFLTICIAFSQKRVSDHEFQAGEKTTIKAGKATTQISTTI